ncbi:class Ib ribonucleoside-diphosphate reductase assembly flavoprotein NrdI [Bacillus mycoides]|uniref:class Ib ribonucleoside-diphosphate reductase assembly flavoprotein NrdI n=1 Tax=Bacillus mycoides TaxID=1405 RepID=UPI000BFAA583|nr:class Ib ribonucleoside-diphosphate reductase assembly flavoprotein NrdI [Bacillus mycoides]PGA05661.1 class Ib ribonucleoside-diphosphate reductase assembly flavoprotein NrdI [Bacillus mycoides]
MLVAYASMTGNVERFVYKLDFPLFNILIHGDNSVDKPFVLVTYTTGFGQVPKEVEEFLETNHRNLVAVVGSGNRNWGTMFCGGAVKVSEKYNVPLLHTFELSGLPSDVDIVTEKIEELERMK